jgi:hypothetical protein
MQRLEVNGAVRPLKWPLGVKWLIGLICRIFPKTFHEGFVVHFIRGTTFKFSEWPHRHCFKCAVSRNHAATFCDMTVASP